MFAIWYQPWSNKALFQERDTRERREEVGDFGEEGRSNGGKILPSIAPFVLESFPLRKIILRRGWRAIPFPGPWTLS